MKDVTAIVLGQSKEYGRKAYLNIKRTDIYRYKIRSIYKRLGRKKMPVRIMAGNTVVGFRRASTWEAMKIVETFGEEFFLRIMYSNTGDAVIVKLTGEVPPKEEAEEES